MSDEKDDSTMPECTASARREAHGRATNRYPAPESRKLCVTTFRAATDFELIISPILAAGVTG